MTDDRHRAAGAGHRLEQVTRPCRRADPGDDLTSFLVSYDFDGKHLDDAQLIDILWNLIGGGVDTTTSLTSLSLMHLGVHPELRQTLIDRPGLYRTAADEFLRYFSVNKQLSRTVSRDTVLGGQPLRRNDRRVRASRRRRRSQ